MVSRLQTLLLWIEETILIVLMSAMILLSSTQILLRNAWDSGIAWGDPVLRILVLWVGLLGAMLATRYNKHIRIDILSRYLPGNWKRYSDGLTDMFSAVVCAVLAWHSGRFVHFEWMDGTEVFTGFPSWIAELILPFGFGVIALRFLLLTWQSLRGKNP
jgi:TRAP-type C4-dicarboxylate transport system permease small subunit